MPISFKPMTPELVDLECDYITASGDSYSAISSYTNANTDPSLTAEANVRTTFRMSHYVINELLAGTSLSKVYAFFGLSQSDASDIASISKVFNKDTGRLERTKNVVDEGSTNILIGGDYLNYLIDKMTMKDFETNICIMAQKATDGIKGASKVLRGAMGVAFEAKSGFDAFPLAEGMYLLAIRKDNVTDEELNNIVQAVLLNMFGNGDSVVSKMLALRKRGIDGVKEFLRGMLLRDIVIVPKGMRPSREGVFLQHDPLDIMYKEVFEADRSMTTLALTSQNITTYVSYYRTLSNKVNYLIHAHEPSKKSRKAIAEKLASKKGQLRGGNLGKRLDYSGRSVIVINPFMSIRKIKIPKKTLPKLYKYHILKKAKELTDAGISGMTPLDMVLSSQASIKGKMLSAIETNRLLETIPVVVGRQPTLHKGSLSSYYAEATDGNAIELSPLIVSMFNADFDGDTMWDTVPLSDKAIEEAQTVLLGTNNLFWAKDGKVAISPRQEIIYGLNTCTKDWKDMGTALPYTLTPAEAYRKVVRNQVRVYDTVKTATGKVTVGKLAFRHCVEPIFNSAKPARVLKSVCVCPKCLSIKEGIPGQCTCDKHTDVQLISVREFWSIKCPNCGSEYDMHKLSDGFESSNERIKHVRSVVEKLRNQYSARIATVELCEAISEIENDYDLFSKVCARIATYDTINKDMFKIDNNLENKSGDELASAIARNKLCRCILAFSNLPKDLQAIFAQDIVAENFGRKTARLSNKAGTFVFTPIGTGFKCANSLADEVEAEKCKSILEEAKTSSYDLNKFSAAIDAVSSCPLCSVITTKSITPYIHKLLVKGKDHFIDAIDKMVTLGFKVAKYYAPPLNVLSDINFDEEFKQFHKDTAEVVEMYDCGFIEDERYADEYSNGLKKLQKSLEDNINSRLGESNGFLKMVQSGARGSISNLIQIYGYKGRVTKSSTEAFNAVIESSYTKQLSPFEHFMAAYGARRGIMDRSLETASTGYISRQLWHATQGQIIQNCDDCGTHDGVVIKRHMLNLFGLSDDKEKRIEEEDKLLVKFITGRYDLDGNLITKKRAKEIVKAGGDVAIRSPITCKNPCCVKCYGRDMSTHDIVVKGTPVGIIAAQGIGETTSQLTMRTFQSGGVAKGGGIGSAFDSMQSYVNMSSMDKLDFFEPTAWTDGKVYQRALPNGDMLVTIAPPGTDESEVWHNLSIRVPAGINLKAEVVRGEGFYVEAGDQYLPHIWNASGIENAAMYLALKLFKIYRSECEINLKHFEILAASMMRAVVLDNKGTRLLTGCSYSYKELLAHGWTPDSPAKLYWKLFKIKDIPAKSPNAVANIDFENMGKGLFDAMVYNRKETFTDPIESIVFGQYPKVGSELNPNYISERTNFKVSEDII